MLIMFHSYRLYSIGFVSLLSILEKFLLNKLPFQGPSSKAITIFFNLAGTMVVIWCSMRNAK